MDEDKGAQIKIKAAFDVFLSNYDFISRLVIKLLIV